MRKMKNSGIEWIGQMPSDWDVIAFWLAIERMATGLNPRDNFELSKSDPFFYVTIRNFKNGSLFLDEQCDRISPHAFDIIQQRAQLQKGDILFASISESGNAYVIEETPENWNINESVFTIRVNKNRFCERYFYYHLINTGYYTDLRMDATGSTFQSIKQNKLRLSKVIMPSLAEQHRIADFLDSTCAEIDAMIASTKATIEEYKALKQAIIIEAVTKGVRGSRPTKDSGIDWIGEVPIDREIIKIKYITDISRGLFNHRPRNDERYYGGKYPFVQTGDVARAGKYITKYSQTLNELGISVSKQFPKGTMAMTIAANIGDVAILGFDAYFPDSVVGFTPKDGFLENYIYYLFCSMKEMFVRTAVVSTQLNLNLDRIKELFIPITRDLDEQKEIANYLDEKCAAIDDAIAKKIALVEELENYKKSVIYEYVTGKKEVQ